MIASSKAGRKRVVRCAPCAVLFLALGASCVYAGDLIPSVEVEGVSRDRVKNELVLRFTMKGEFRLVQETNFQLSFERDEENVGGKKIYQTSVPVERLTFTIADTGHGSQVVASIVIVENNGTPFERRTVLRTGKDVQEAQELLASIKSRFDFLEEKAMTGSVSSILQDHPHESTRAMSRAPIARNALKNIAPPRLGFSAELLKANDGRGFIITAVDPKTPAAKAGLQPLDIVTSIDGQPLETSEQMDAVRATLGKKKRSKVTVIRDGKSYDATLKF